MSQKEVTPRYSKSRKEKSGDVEDAYFKESQKRIDKQKKDLGDRFREVYGRRFDFDHWYDNLYNEIDRTRERGKEIVEIKENIFYRYRGIKRVDLLDDTINLMLFQRQLKHEMGEVSGIKRKENKVVRGKTVLYSNIVDIFRSTAKKDIYLKTA